MHAPAHPSRVDRVYPRTPMSRFQTFRARVVAVILGALLLSIGPAAGAASGATRAFRTGFTDFDAYQTTQNRAAALSNTRRTGASFVRLPVAWRVVAPSAPPTLEAARDPGWDGYHWETFDPVVRDAVASGLTPVLILAPGAPAWAEGPDRPRVSRDAPAGSWRPSHTQFAAFAEAAARRYSGRFSDPAIFGRALPRVRYWQLWNEPNLTDFLTPQWSGAGSATRAVSPSVYRALLNAGYGAVKSVDGSNLVLTAGTAPFGEPTRGQRRMAPAFFWRALLCVRGRRRHSRAPCPEGPVRFDILAHHPYPVGPPDRRAANPDDISVPDIRKITGPLKVARAAKTVLPATPKQIWVTELSYDTSPPDPDGIPADLQARYVERSFYELWRRGVNTVVWYLLRDAPKGRGYQFDLQSGVYFRAAAVEADTPKPALRAFTFPFVVSGRGSRARLWGVAPETTGAVRIEERRGGVWRHRRSLHVGPTRVFLARFRARRHAVLRARQGSRSSLPWTVA
jgi:hypothetical protein